MLELCDGEERVGSKRFDVLEPPRSSAEAPYTSLRWCGSCRFAVLEPPRSSAEAPYTLCSLCGGVFPVGSKRFDVLQQPRTSKSACASCVGPFEVRGIMSKVDLAEMEHTYTLRFARELDHFLFAKEPSKGACYHQAPSRYTSNRAQRTSSNLQETHHHRTPC